MSRDSVTHTLTVAAVLCVVCSLLVSVAAVGLRPLQVANKERAQQKNILVLTGLYDENEPVEQTFEQIETRIIDLETGKFVDESEIDPNTYDQRKAAGDAELSVTIDPEKDVANIKRREKYSYVYLVRKGDTIDQIVLPVYGKGLWSTMYAFLSLDADANTIRGITFYEHGETAGLGGEIENKNWQESWSGKRVFDDDANIQLHVIKGPVDRERPEAVFEIDGISGATITVNGVTKMIRYWLGPDGFGPYLTQYKTAGGVQ